MVKEKLTNDTSQISDVYKRNIAHIYRACFLYMKNAADAEDAAADTFYKYMVSMPKLDSEEHEKAWLIRTAINICKDRLKSSSRKDESIDEHYDLQTDISRDDTLEIVMSLPEKYKSVIFLYYYEEYDSVQIAEILGKPKSTIRNYLSEARDLLRIKIGGER